MKIIELKPVKESTADFERIESRIKLAFKRILYLPLLKELGLSVNKVLNAKEDLIKALETGRITVSRRTFRGRFTAETSRTLKKLGAEWKNGKFYLEKIPLDIREAIATGNVRFKERVARIDKKLKEMDSAKIAEHVKTADLFSSTLEKTDREIGKTLTGVGVHAQLSPNEREKIAGEWQTNMDLWINNFTEKEIKSLRETIAQSAFEGNRYEHLVDSIQKSYGVTANKAKFLARQETGLLMAKFKETRYTSSGIKEYKWRCVAGSKNHPVRPSHKILDGKVFAWDDPPITSAPTESVRRNNPGQDYNCRCAAIPIIKLKDK